MNNKSGRRLGTKTAIMAHRVVSGMKRKDPRKGQWTFNNTKDSTPFHSSPGVALRCVALRYDCPAVRRVRGGVGEGYANANASAIASAIAWFFRGPKAPKKVIINEWMDG